MLKHRILTACILVPLVLLAIFFLPPLPYHILVGLVLLPAGWEWSKLIGLTKTKDHIIYLLILVVGFLVTLFIPMKILLGINILFWLAVLFFASRYRQFTRIWQYKSIRYISGLWLLLAAYIGLLIIRAVNDGPFLLLTLLLIVWVADTAAYFAGKRWGRHKMAPEISPGKTWEGFAGAVLCVFVMAFTLAFFMPFNSHPVLTIVLFLATLCFSVLGDLFESMVKRQAQVKDSGQWLPGHGGLLDRMDSLLAAAPCFTLGVLQWFV